MAHQAAGADITADINTNLAKSVESFLTIPSTLAPNTLRIPISFFRRSADKVAKPNKPIHEIRIVSIGPKATIVFHFASLSYCSATSASLNLYWYGIKGKSALNSFWIRFNDPDLSL